MPKSSTDAALAFVRRINAHDVEGILRLMSDDHRFIDGLGKEVNGKESMREAWASYFAWFPDYHISVERKLAAEQWVAIFGRASGTFNEQVKTRPERDSHWDIPAAWKARVDGGLVSEWQVFADSEPVWKVMGVRRY